MLMATFTATEFVGGILAVLALALSWNKGGVVDGAWGA